MSSWKNSGQAAFYKMNSIEDDMMKLSYRWHSFAA